MLAGSVFFKIEFLAANLAGDRDPLPLSVEVSRAEGDRGRWGHEGTFAAFRFRPDWGPLGGQFGPRL